MDRLPTPPDAYWANIPWWGYIGFLLLALLILFVLAPWIIQRARGAPSAMVSREAAIADRERAAWARADTERIDLATDRDRGWDLARGMEVEAHRIWHDSVNAIQRANALLILVQRVAARSLKVEVLAEMVRDQQPLPAPAPIPRLIEVEPKAPHETRYQ